MTHPLYRRPVPVEEHHFAAGDRVTFRSGGLGKLNNVVLDSVAQKLGRAPCTVVAVVDNEQVIIRNEDRQEETVLRVWLVPTVA